MQEGKLIAISDVHIDNWRENSPETFDEKRRAFLEFLRWVREGSECEHFAIVGDLLDIPRPHHEPILPAFQDIAIMLMSLVQAGIKVHYLIGNHDAGWVGIDVDMAHPPFHIGYPGTKVRCGDMEVWLEHGHLMDAWLWEYVQRKTSALEHVSADVAMAHFARCPGREVHSTPPTASIHDTVYTALQWRPHPSGFTYPEKRRGLQIMSQHLDDTFADVADGGETPTKHEEIMAYLGGRGLTVADLQGETELTAEADDLFMSVGSRYYSALPWRRAAKCKMNEVRTRHGPQVRGFIMGHIHCADHYSWQEGETRLTYANCGTWSADGGPYVSVDDCQIISHPRLWSDPLP